VHGLLGGFTRPMRAKRYSLILADRVSGTVYRRAVPVRPALAALAVIVGTPVALAVFAQWSAVAEVAFKGV